MKPLTAHMKTTLLDLYTVVLDYDNGEPLHPHDVKDVHHKILRGLDSRKLILLEASYSPTGVIWTVALTVKGLREAKKLSKQKQVINDQNINDKGKKKKLPRKLKTLQWQVNVNNDKGIELYEEVKAMKKDPKQSFTQTMNNLFALHKELKAGQVGLLQTLYPEAYSAMLLIVRNEIEIEREGELRGIIAEFKRLMVSQPAKLPSNFDFDDNEDTLLLSVQKDENAGRNANVNFLRSAMALNPQPAPTGIRTITAQTFDVPDYDDEDDLFGQE